MNYYSTAGDKSKTTLQEAVVRGLASDKGLFMPEELKKLAESFYENIADMSLQDIASAVAVHLFGEDIPEDKISQIAKEALDFDIPLVEVEEGIYSLELFHGPTFAFKDVGARFMARMLSYFVKEESQDMVNVLVATSGDTGSAVANGFLGVDGIRVFVLYPSGKVSDIQEAQFTTLGKNIVAIEVDGTFDDCQALVKSAFMDDNLKSQMNLTSANSINVARFLPQSFYYFYAYAQLMKMGVEKDVVVSVPSGNLGNLTAGLFAKHMGLDIKRFIAANNRNDVFFNYLQTGDYAPKASVQTIANAMDVGNPSNFDRILDLYNHSHESISADISGFRYTDEEIRDIIEQVYSEKGYLLDPHGACAYMATKEDLKPGEVGVFLGTAHPAKFKDVVEECIKHLVEVPDRLAAFMKEDKQTIKISANYSEFRNLLLENA